MTAKGTANFNEALRRGALEARQAGVAVVLSDFLDPAGYESGLTALVARGFQVDAVQILSPDELAPSTFGDLRLVDAETGGMEEVTFGRYRLGSYQQMVQNFCQRLREHCQARGHQLLSRQFQHGARIPALETTPPSRSLGLMNFLAPFAFFSPSPSRWWWCFICSSASAW